METTDRGQHPPGPGSRRGPRPLAMHLWLAAVRQQACKPESPSWSAAWLNWSASLPEGANAPPPLAVDRALIAGIAAYRRHPAMRDVVDPPEIWRQGAASLRDYGGAGRTVLLVPSLINRGTILDLAQDNSMARYLVERGLRVLLLEWGWPGAHERAMGLEALIGEILLPALAAAGARVALVGYCMGGLMALAAAVLGQERLAGLALLATPWDFHAGEPGLEARVTRLQTVLEPVLRTGQSVPVDALQWLFSLAEPHAVGDKYRAFGALDQASARARRFVLLEDWLADGVPLGATVAQECLSDWYGTNAPARLAWRIGGEVVDPGRIRVPTLLAIPSRDRIVPPDSAMALARCFPDATLLRPPSGHVGMVAGEAARSALWQKLADWATAL